MRSHEVGRAGKGNDRRQGREPVVPRGRILIVDDEEVIAATLKEFLQGEGFEVATARDLPSALAQVEAFEPEIVLCDVQLPGADGITVLNRVLQIRPETLFIMITAYATVENAVAAFQRGAHDYLMKPVLFEDLLAKIDRLIRFRRLLQENQALRRQLHAQGDLDALVGESPPIQAVKTLIRKVGPTRTHGADHGRVGDRQGAGGPRTSCAWARPATRCSWRSTARPSRTICWRTSSSATCEARSPGPIATTPGCSSRPGGGRSSSTRSASCRGRPRPSCCGRSRTRKSCRSAPRAPSRSRPGC